MIWFLAALVVVVMGGVAALAAGRGAPMSDAYDDRPDALVPRDRPLEGDDVRRIRFSLAFRGYRMSEVDALLERVARQLDPPEPPAQAPSEPRPETPLRASAEAPSWAPPPRHAADPAETDDTPASTDVRGDDHTT